jgi:hypothetical protein
VAAAFVVSRLCFAAAGVRFDASAAHPSNLFQVQWQLLDLGLLRHDLLRSVWYLHSQPPLYNLAVGLLLHVPPGARTPVAASVFVLLGLAMALSGYGLMAGLGLPVGASVAVSVLLCADPTGVLYENWLSWSQPTAAFLSVACLLALHGWRTGRARHLFGSAALLCAALMLDSTFQWPWMVAASVLLVAGLRRAAPRGGGSARRLRVRAAAVLAPLVLVGGLYVKDAALFGTFTTSSWLGMNLANTTLAPAPPARIAALVRSGRLPPLALTRPFSALSAYPGRTYRSAIPALGRPTLDGGETNFNQGAYIAISGAYQSAALRYIEADPGSYAAEVGRSLALWTLPGSQYGYLVDSGPIAGYDRWFDRLLLTAPQPAPTLAQVLRTGRAPLRVGEVSWVEVLIGLLSVIGAPLAVLRRRRRSDRAGSAALALIWVTVAYSAAVTSLISVGENMRFHAELGVLPVVAAAAVVAECRPSLLRRGDTSRDD